MLLCPSEQRRNILSVSYGRLTSHLVRVWVEFCSRFTLGKTLIGRYITNIAPQNIKRVVVGVLCNEKFPQQWFAICLWRPTGTENQNTHVSSLISLWLLLLAAGPSSGIGSKCACLTVCFCFQRSLPHPTWAPTPDIKVGLHLWSCLMWCWVCWEENVIKLYGQRKWSVLHAKQIGFIQRKDHCLSYKSLWRRADSKHY